MKRVGFWRERDFFDGRPDPHDLVDHAWDARIRSAVVAHLKAGRVHERYFGYSWCRFRCGRHDQQMGHADLTDGAYVWPEGFAHYVEEHGVRPPADFVEHVMKGGCAK